MTHRRWLIAIVLLLAGRPALAAAAGLDPIVRVSVLPGREITQGERGQVDLSVVPPADAPGDLSVLFDGLGTTDGFVRRMSPTPFYCPYGGCGTGRPPEPCPAGRVCFILGIQLDVRAALGRTEFPITIRDARGRETPVTAVIDVRPALDRDADGMPDAWEEQFRLSSRDGGGPADDPNGNGVSNLEEFRRGTNPRARSVRFFAEASSGDRAPGLEQCFQLAPLEHGFAGTWFTLVGDGGRRLLTEATTRNRGVFCPLDRRSHLADRVVAVMVESELPSVIERVAVTPDEADGLFGTTGVAGPLTRWLFADGGTDGILDTFYLAYNTGAAPVEATFTYRGPEGAVRRRHTSILPPGVRTTLWVNADDAPLGRTEAWVEIEAAAPILVERAWRFDPPGRTVTHAYASPGADQASSRWLFPEIDGGGAFATSIVLANPDAREAVLTVTLLSTDRDDRVAGQVRIPPGGRITVPAAAILPGSRASVEIASANGVDVIAERVFTGHDAGGPWRLATPGIPEAGEAWTLANLIADRDRELVFSNVSAFPARVELHFYPSYGFDDQLVTTIEIPARRRLVYPLPADYSVPWVAGTLQVTSQPTDRGTAAVVVETVRYADIGGVARARGAGVAASKVR